MAFTPFHRSSEEFLTSTRSVLHSSYTSFNLPLDDHLVPGLKINLSTFDSFRLRVHGFTHFTLVSSQFAGSFCQGRPAPFFFNFGFPNGLWVVVPGFLFPLPVFPGGFLFNPFSLQRGSLVHLSNLRSSNFKAFGLWVPPIFQGQDFSVVPELNRRGSLPWSQPTLFFGPYGRIFYPLFWG